MFATIGKVSKFFFAGQGHAMFDDGGEGKNSSIVEIWVVFVSEVEMHGSATFGIWFGQRGDIGVNYKDHVIGQEHTTACGFVAT